jgi:hypothetical protein
MPPEPLGGAQGGQLAAASRHDWELDRSLPWSPVAERLQGEPASAATRLVIVSSEAERLGDDECRGMKD